MDAPWSSAITRNVAPPHASTPNEVPSKSHHLPWWTWIRFVPVKLHLVGLIVGGIVAERAAGLPVQGKSAVFWLGAFLGLLIGASLQILKRISHQIAVDARD